MDFWTFVFLFIGIGWCADKFLKLVEYIGEPNHGKEWHL